MSLRPGLILADRYEVEHELGRGGMGRVHQVRHRLLGSVHALKVLAAPMGGHQQARLLAEGRLQARLDHPNLVRVTDVVALDGGVGLVMDLVSGGTLRDRLARGPVPRDEAMALGAGILAGVAAVHAARVVHRDIKPENVLLSSDGRPRVADFGIARAPDPSLREGVHTREGVGMGTPGYMAPEAYRDAAHVDARADVFALGALLYELFSGHRTFAPGLPWMEMGQLAREGRYVPLDVRMPDLPAPLVALVHAALAPERDRRPADAEVLAELWAKMDRAPSGSARTRASETVFADSAPEGELALVFSDIEGSSVLWDRHGSSFMPALALHDRLLRAAAQQEGGYEVKSEGDSFFFAFQRAEAGLRFCLAAQRALQQAEWLSALEAPAPGLQVRMGMHVGAPERALNPTTRRVDYFGPVVNRAARVAEAAHGGQILLSGPADEATRSVGAEAERRDLGLFRLKGLEKLERLVQVLPLERAGRRFPPPRARPPARARASRFFGRERELRALREQLRAGSRLITVLGPGGAGKTRLAEQLLETSTLTAGGSTLALLADAHDRDGFVRAVAGALGVALENGDLVEALAMALSVRGPTLLVLDNAEHLLAHVREAVPRWLAAAPELRLLVTSQARLDLEGELVQPLGPLPEAGALLLERGQSVRPDLVADEALLERIADALDRLPLAIELAASRLNVYSLAQLHDRLSERFRLLRGGRAPGRHATLEAAIGWSWELLSPVEQRAIGRCAVFRGGFSLEAAEAVLEGMGGPWPDELLATAVDHSLLRRVEAAGREPRFALYESVRAFALDRLSEDERREAEARHRAFFAQLGSPEALRDLGWLDSGVRRRVNLELENLLVAVETGLAAGDAAVGARAWLAINRGASVPVPYPSMARSGQALLDAPALSDPDALELGASMCSKWRSLGEVERARAALHRVEEAARRSGGLVEELAATLIRAQLVVALEGSDTSAEALFQEVARRGRAHTVEIWMAAEASLARLEVDRRACAEARVRLLGLLQAPDIGRRVLGLTLHEDLATLAHRMGRWSEAREHLTWVVHEARFHGLRRVLWAGLLQLALLVWETGANDEARAFGDELLRMGREVGALVMVSGAYNVLGLVAQQAGRLDEAEACLQRSREAAVRSRHPRPQSASAFQLGRCLALRGRAEEAEALFSESRHTRGGGSRYRTAATQELAALLARRGEISEAMALMDEIPAPDAEALPLDACRYLYAQAEVLARSGDLGAAEGALHEAARVLARLELPAHAPLPRAYAELRGRLAKISPTIVPA